MVNGSGQRVGPNRLGESCSPAAPRWASGPLRGAEKVGAGTRDGAATARTCGAVLVSAFGSRRRLSISALTATMKLEPDMDRAAISGRSTKPKAGSKTPAAMGRAMAL